MENERLIRNIATPFAFEASIENGVMIVFEGCKRPQFPQKMKFWPLNEILDETVNFTEINHRIYNLPSCMHFEKGHVIYGPYLFTKEGCGRNIFKDREV